MTMESILACLKGAPKPFLHGVTWTIICTSTVYGIGRISAVIATIKPPLRPTFPSMKWPCISTLAGGTMSATTATKHLKHPVTCTNIWEATILRIGLFVKSATKCLNQRQGSPSTWDSIQGSCLSVQCVRRSFRVGTVCIGMRKMFMGFFQTRTGPNPTDVKVDAM